MPEGCCLLHLCALVLLCINIHSLTAETAIVYVDEADGIDKPICLTGNSSTPCGTLEYALLGVSNYVLDSIKILISSGHYSLTEQMQFNETKTFILSGQGSEDTVIACFGHGGGIVFNACENITISNATFVGCGKNRSVELMEESSPSLSFNICRDVSIVDTHITQSYSSAVRFDSCIGLVLLKNSRFTDNNNHPTDCTRGGGVNIEPVDEGRIQIDSCTFIGNQASTGGAMYIEINQPTITDVQVMISNSVFVENVASQCDQNDENYLDGTGGGLSLFVTTLQPNTTVITIINSTFTNNTAITGAGVQYYIWNSRSTVQLSVPILSIVGSVLDGNFANIGSGVLVSPVNFNSDGFRYHVNFEDNIFIDNIVQANRVHTGIGTVVLRNININLTGVNQFIGNDGSALVLLNSILKVEDSSKTHFISNIGFNGGGLQLNEESSLLIGRNTFMLFDGNLVSGRGGAIYYSTLDTFWKLPHSCFLQYIQGSNSSIFIFSENKARNEINAVYSNALSQCIIESNGESDTSLIFCQNNWVYNSSSCRESIISEAVDFVFDSNKTNTLDLFSGTPAVVPVTAIDFFGTNLTENIALSAETGENDDANVNPNFGIVSNNNIELAGKQNTSGSLHLQTRMPPFVEIDIPYHIQQCPPGFIATSDNKCQCAEVPYTEGTLVCNNENLISQLIITNCMSSYGSNDSILVAGTCQFLFGYANSSRITLPQDPSLVEEAVCGPLNRQGVLCGACKDGYSPAAYSYLNECTKCNEVSGWFVYIAAQYMPIFVLFVLVTVFNLTIITPATNAFLFLSQVSSLSNAYVFDSFLTNYALGDTQGPILVKFYYFINGFWNLDFFRSFVPPICLFEKQNALVVVFLDYIAAFFPLTLLIATYMLIVLYNKNFRLIVWGWKPFELCLSKVHTNFQPRASLVDVFVTFFVLSYLKIIATTFRFLQYVFVYDINGNILDVVYYYDGNIKLFHGIHIPFAVLSLVTLFTVILIPPILLTCYQFRWFQKLLEKLHLRSQALITFVEVIQSGLADGREGTKDRRFFAGFYFILRLLIFGPTTVITNTFVRTLVPLAVYALGIIVLVVTRPYRKSFYNKLDVCILLNLLFSSFVFILSLVFSLSGASGSTIAPLMYLTYTIGSIPIVFMIGYVIRWICITTKICKGKCITNSRNDEFSAAAGKSKLSASTFSAPDRIIQPEFYQSLMVDDQRVNSIQTDTKNSKKTTTDDVEGDFGEEYVYLDLDKSHELSVYSEISN